MLRGAEGLSTHLTEQVLAYLDEPSPGAVLVMVARSLDGRSRLARRAGEVGERISVRTPAPWQDTAWDRLVRDELARHERSVEDSAVRALRDHGGADPAALAVRCAQVAEATTRGATVTVTDVERVVTGHGNHGGFAVADAVADRDPRTALVTLRGAREAGEEPLRLLGAVTFRLRQLLQVRAGRSAEQVGISPGMHRRLRRWAAGFTAGELAWCHDRASHADLALKGSDLPADVVLDLAVVELATSRRVGAPWNPRA